MTTRAARERRTSGRRAGFACLLAILVGFGNVAAGSLAGAWADETDEVTSVVTSDATGPAEPLQATNEEEASNQAPPADQPEAETDLQLMLAAVRSSTGSPEFSIDGQFLGKQVAPGSTETAVCVSQHWEETNPTTTQVALNILVPTGDYAVLTFTLPASWVANNYTYTVSYKGYRPELVFNGSDGSADPVTAELVGIFNGDVLTGFKTTVLFVPTGQNVPTDYYPSGQDQLASTTGLPVVRVPAGTATTLDMRMDLSNTYDLGGEGKLPATTMTATSDFYTSSNGRVTTAVDSIAIPPFVRIDANAWWISTFWQYGCPSIPDVQPIAPSPTISKSFEPALIQPGGTSTLSITIANNSAGTATGAWSFEDQLPSVNLGGNTNTPVTLRLAATPNWTTTGCTITNYAAYPGGTTLSAAGNITPGQAACVITIQVMADASLAANYSTNNQLGYFDPHNQNFAFPIDLANRIDAAAASNSGLSGTATAVLRVDVPNLKVDVSPPTITGGAGSPITATWTITVVNATNLEQNGQFTANDPNEQVPANNVVVTSKLSAGLTNLVWNAPSGATVTDLVDDVPQGTWSIPTIAAGQFFQATLAATVTDLASLLALNVVGTSATLGATQALFNEVQATMGDLPNPAVTLLPNEEPNNDTLTALAASWAAQHNFAMPTDTYRIASVEADSDRWDKVATEFAAAVTLSATPSAPRITGVGPIQITYTVTNPQAVPLKNVVVVDALLGGVICTFNDLAPNATDSCVGSYDVSALEIKERTREKPLDTDEGIWWDDQVGQAFLHLVGAVSGNAAYLNPATSMNPQGSVWTIREPTPGAYTVRAATAIQLPLLTPGDLGGWLVLPFTGRSGAAKTPTFDYLVFAAELTLLAGFGRLVLGTGRRSSGGRNTNASASSIRVGSLPGGMAIG